jgi:hypothetical protein
MGLPSVLFLLCTDKYTLLSNHVERFSGEWDENIKRTTSTVVLERTITSECVSKQP